MTSTPSGRVGFLGALAIAAWLITGDRMDGMDAGPGAHLGGLGWFAGVWVVMMAAMMFPSIMPMVVAYARAGPVRLGTAMFVGGYLFAWTAAGLAAYALFDAVSSLDLGFLAWDEGGRFVAAGVLLGAAIYELTPLKDACLGRCRDRVAFMRRSWRPGRIGAARMGVVHGAWCVACCWALMAALFALGVMSIAWMAVIAALIATERLLPWKAAAVRGVAAVLLALAVAVAVAPEQVPGLTLPDSSEAMPMKGLGM